MNERLRELMLEAGYAAPELAGRADAVTQNQDGTYSLRFPRFKGFRGFEPGEKL